MFVKKEINFNKYKERGAYHWQGIGKNVFYSNAFLKARYQMVLNQIPLFKNKEKVIDIGCGDGALSYLIKTKKGGEISGIDPSPEAIKIAQSKFDKFNVKNCSFKTGSGYRLPYKDNSFDYAVLADVIEHVNQPEKILKETKRVLKKKGIIVASSVIKSSDIPEDKMHVKEYSANELKNMLEKYFDNVKIRKTHNLFLKKIYQFSLIIGKFKPQIFRYAINILTNVFAFNPFVLCSCPKLTCQTLIGVKK